jgi:hypothetical protein
VNLNTARQMWQLAPSYHSRKNLESALGPRLGAHSRDRRPTAAVQLAPVESAGVLHAWPGAQTMVAAGRYGLAILRQAL